MVQLEPQRFGRYLLIDRISVGGMAEVYLAKSAGAGGFEKLLAIKRILPIVAEDADFRTMFIDEAQISARLNHANIGQVFEFGEIHGGYFIAMEYVPGQDLRSIRRRLEHARGYMPVPMALHIIGRVAQALDYAHRQKFPDGRSMEIIHRDVSPPNVLVSYDGWVKLIDFGIARAATRATRTRAGKLKGKFAYMSPEQIDGRPLDQRSDIFSTGIVLYEMLTNSRPFEGKTQLETLNLVRRVDPPPPSSINPDVPLEIDRIVARALHKDREQRYGWASELRADLERYFARTETVFEVRDLAEWLRTTFAEQIAEHASLMKKVGGLQVEDFPPDRLEPAPPVAVPDTAPEPAARGVGAPPATAAVGEVMTARFARLAAEQAGQAPAAPARSAAADAEDWATELDPRVHAFASSGAARSPRAAVLQASPRSAKRPDGELLDGSLPDDELPPGELPADELPDGELPDSELPGDKTTITPQRAASDGLRAPEGQTDRWSLPPTEQVAALDELADGDAATFDPEEIATQLQPRLSVTEPEDSEPETPRIVDPGARGRPRVMGPSDAHSNERLVALPTVARDDLPPLPPSYEEQQDALLDDAAAAPTRIEPAPPALQGATGGAIEADSADTGESYPSDVELDEPTFAVEEPLKQRAMRTLRSVLQRVRREAFAAVDTLRQLFSRLSSMQLTIVAAATTFLVAGAIVIVIVRSTAPDPSSSDPADALTGSMFITTTPAASCAVSVGPDLKRLLIPGRPLSLSGIQAGPHQVTLTCPGFRLHSATETVRPAQVTVVKAQLQEE